MNQRQLDRQNICNKTAFCNCPHIAFGARYCKDMLYFGHIDRFYRIKDLWEYNYHKAKVDYGLIK